MCVHMCASACESLFIYLSISISVGVGVCVSARCDFVCVNVYFCVCMYMCIMHNTLHPVPVSFFLISWPH